MEFVRNFPFIGIFLCMSTGVINSILVGKWAKRVSFTVITGNLLMSIAVLIYVCQTNQSYVYVMGHHPAPWGNEIRLGILEAAFATFFCLIMLLSVLGGVKRLEEDISEKRSNLFYVMVNLLMAAILALTYTNDLFTAYVFVEIMTIGACGIIVIRGEGRSLLASVKYMIMSLLGSGLILIGLTLIYDLTGHLLMSNIQQAAAELVKNGQYQVPFTSAIALISVGLAMKSALFPFHSWLPDAYTYATSTSSAILSSLVSKAYIFLLIKIYYRVIGLEIIFQNKILNVLFFFGILGMIIGSLSAIMQDDLKKMIAYSSVAQIGYIYMGIGLGTEAGMLAAVFHIMSHAASKSMMFISASGLSQVSGRSCRFQKLIGAAHRNKIAGFAFLFGAFSMVGIPMTAGYISKVYFSQAAIQTPSQMKMIVTVVTLGISTILNAVYFIRAVIVIYRPTEETKNTHRFRTDFRMSAVLLCFVATNLFLGMHSDAVIDLLRTGLGMFD
ncbi:MAG: proton-conducting transporter membrane subunit [Lachnospiraceae bacterium]|nr:proton-conducting transporter membrane subunit [Lachnospiraceae bacterium]